MTPSEAFVETLRSEGVECVTGLVGSAFQDALDLFPAAGIRFVTVHHEQTAAHMADAYARTTGRPAVCIAQNGPGCTNMLTGIAAAYQAHSPVVVVTPSAMSTMVGVDGLQEADQMEIFKSITRFQVRVPARERMAESMRAAFRHAVAKLGPAQVDIPRDFFYGESEQIILQPEEYRVDRRGAGDPDQHACAARLLSAAKSPVIVAGYGCVLANAYEITAKLAEFISAPVVNTFWHNDSFPTSHFLSVGALGFSGSKVAMQLLAEADVVLMLGSRINDFGYAPQYGIKYYPEKAKIIQVDLNPVEIGRTHRINVGIIGDARLAAEQIFDILKREGAARADKMRLSQIETLKMQWKLEQEELCRSAGTTINPYAAIRDVCKLIPANAVVTTDIGFAPCATNSFLRFDSPRNYIAPGNFANCGFGFPAALGAKLARPQDPVVAIVGDGGWGFALQEVMTSIDERLPITAVVLNNGILGAEKANQLTYLSGRYLGVDVARRFNYAAIAQAMGAKAVRIERIEDLAPAFRVAVASNETWVVEVMIDPQILNKPFRGEALAKAVRYLERYKHLSV